MRRRVPVPVLGDVFDLMNGACAQFRRENRAKGSPDPSDGPGSPVTSPRSDGPAQSAGAEARAPGAPTPPEASAVFPHPVTDEYDPEAWALALGGDGPSLTSDGLLAIPQASVGTEVFVPLHKAQACSVKYFSAAVVEYLRSLEHYKIPLEGLMHDFLVDMLMHCAPPEFHRLHQFIQFQAIASQVSTAFQLLKVEDRWPPSFQLAMDMLSKLKAYAEMIEVYLARGKVVAAVELMIRFNVTNVSEQAIVDRALECEDQQEKFTALQLVQKWKNGAGSQTALEDHIPELMDQLM
uniref:Mic1 domain-containing protein n=1 Tax=Eutreptiella gymnastica TaxID=73025 RepID=A0A7S4D003_9EUGL